MEASLYLTPAKCQFHKETVKYLCLIVSTKGISMDSDKVGTVPTLSDEKKIHNGRLNNIVVVQQFLGFFNYYR
jgi:hypothetical protein